MPTKVVTKGPAGDKKTSKETTEAKTKKPPTVTPTKTTDVRMPPVIKSPRESVQDVLLEISLLANILTFGEV